MSHSADHGLTPPSPEERAFDAVAIGASAGGVEVLGVLLAALPARFVPAVIVVTHVPSDGPSHLAQALARYCRLPVLEPDAGQPLEGGQVYVAPPGYHMLVADDHTVALSIDAQVGFSRPSIDVLFESAAHLYRHRLLGILLSGGNQDGSAGLMRIRASGGATWVQAPDSAAAPTMPRAAIARGGAETILSPLAMAARLASLPALS